MFSQDTDSGARAVQLTFYRMIGPHARVALALEMSEQARAVSEAGVRARHPAYSDEQVKHAVLRLVLGDELYRRVWPDRWPIAP